MLMWINNIILILKFIKTISMKRKPTKTVTTVLKDIQFSKWYAKSCRRLQPILGAQEMEKLCLSWDSSNFETAKDYEIPALSVLLVCSNREEHEEILTQYTLSLFLPFPFLALLPPNNSKELTILGLYLSFQ